ncbi:MAG: SCP2 sterol-binding domain-containing protein [Micromonosporaceae bacterium]|nr:SCP2 sterol-binding domain-containing protein [Micromonosporaceae bacterium]
MATIDECRAALERLAKHLAENAATTRERLSMDRTLACRITDLNTAFHGRLLDGQIIDLADGDNSTANIGLIASSDDLIDLVDGRLHAGAAFASGRIKIKASMMDILRLRKLL